MNQNHAEKHPGSSDLAARIASYELAYRMQMCAPEAVDISNGKRRDQEAFTVWTTRLRSRSETVSAGPADDRARRTLRPALQRLHHQPECGYVGCARQHRRQPRQHAPEVDKPITGLITDLKRRGLLDETLVIWHSEFGRMPISQRGIGRDHNPGAKPCSWRGRNPGRPEDRRERRGWLQGGGAGRGCHDLHATLLHLLGIDHKTLTYYFNGRHMRLTDVHGELIPQIAGEPRSVG